MLLQGWLSSNWWWGGRATVVVGVGCVGWKCLQFYKNAHNIYVLATGNIVAHHWICHPQKPTKICTYLMAAERGRFNRQISNSKMAAKTEYGGCKIGVSRLNLLVWPISSTMQKFELLPKRVSDQFNKNGTWMYGLQRADMLFALLNCIEPPK